MMRFFLTFEIRELVIAFPVTFLPVFAMRMANQDFLSYYSILVSRCISLGAQEEVFPYIERAKITEFTDKEQAYAVFIKFYLDFCINKRIEQEACVANNACKQELCADYNQATPNNSFTNTG